MNTARERSGAGMPSSGTDVSEEDMLVDDDGNTTMDDTESINDETDTSTSSSLDSLLPSPCDSSSSTTTTYRTATDNSRGTSKCRSRIPTERDTGSRSSCSAAGMIMNGQQGVAALGAVAAVGFGSKNCTSSTANTYRITLVLPGAAEGTNNWKKPNPSTSNNTNGSTGRTNMQRASQYESKADAEEEQQQKQFSLSMVYSDDSENPTSSNIIALEDAEQGSHGSRDSEGNFTVYWQRWLMLFYMSMLNLLSDWTCYSVAPISVLTSQTFGNVEPTLLVTVFLAANAVATAVEPMILSRLGLRGTIVLGAFLLLGGSWTKSGIPFYSQLMQKDTMHQAAAGAWKVYLGFFLVGLSQPLYQCTPALLSNSWFPERERTMATGISLNANQLGIGCAFVFGTILVDQPEDIPRYFSLITLLSIFLFLGTLLQFDDAPPTPPSNSARVIRGNFSINLSKHVWEALQKKIKQPNLSTNQPAAAAAIATSSISSSSHSNVRQRCVSSTIGTTSDSLIPPSNAFMSQEPVRNTYSSEVSATNNEHSNMSTTYDDGEVEEEDEEPIWQDDEDDEDDNYLTPHSPPVPPTYYWGFPTPPYHLHQQPLNSNSAPTVPYQYYFAPKFYFHNHNAFATFSDDSNHTTLYSDNAIHELNMPLPLPPTIYDFDEGAEPIEIVAPHKISIDIRDDQIWLSAKACFSRKGFVHSCVAFVVSGIVINTLSTYMDYLVRLGGAGKSYVGIVGGSFQLIIMLSSLLVGRYADETRRYYTVAICLLVMGAFALAESCVRLDEDDGPQLRLTLLAVAALVGPLQPIATELGVDVAYPLSENTVLVIQQLFSNLLSAVFIQFFDFCKDIGRHRIKEDEGDFYRQYRPEYTFSFYLLIVLHACGTVFFATFNGRYLRFEAEEAKKNAKRRRHFCKEEEDTDDSAAMAVGERQPLLVSSMGQLVTSYDNNCGPSSAGYGTA
jgi:MFS family permease